MDSGGAGQTFPVQRASVVSPVATNYKSDLDILGADFRIFIKKEKTVVFCKIFVDTQSSRTFSSEGLLQQMRVLINSTQPYLQNKTDPGQKCFEMKRLQTVEHGRQNDFSPLAIYSKSRIIE